MENALRYYCTAIFACGLCYHTSIRSSKYLHAKLWYHTVPFHTKQYHISESSLFRQCSQSSHLQTFSNCAIFINRLESNQNQFKTKFKPMPHFHSTKFNQQRHQIQNHPKISLKFTLPYLIVLKELHYLFHQSQDRPFITTYLALQSYLQRPALSVITVGDKA